jgi:hypothetical protein
MAIVALLTLIVGVATAAELAPIPPDPLAPEIGAITGQLMTEKFTFLVALTTPDIPHELHAIVARKFRESNKALADLNQLFEHHDDTMGQMMILPYLPAVALAYNEAKAQERGSTSPIRHSMQKYQEGLDGINAIREYLAYRAHGAPLPTDEIPQ